MKRRGAAWKRGTRSGTDLQGGHRHPFVTLQNSNTSFQRMPSSCDICGFVKRSMHHCALRICHTCLGNVFRRQMASGVGKCFCPICFCDFTADEIRRIGSVSLETPTKTVTTPTVVVETEQLGSMACPVCRSSLDMAISNDDSTLATCSKCKITHCRTCKAVPFHFGEVCRRPMNALSTCVVCGLGTIQGDTCSAKCSAAAKDRCMRLKECGHLCDGVKGETEHPPCRLCDPSNCCAFCSVLYKPTQRVVMACGHPAHIACLREIPVPGDGILQLPHCPLCQKRCERTYLSNEWKALYVSIMDIAEKWSCAHNRSKDEPVEHVLDYMRIGRCANKHREIFYVAGCCEDPKIGGDRLCPSCNCHVFPRCPIHGHEFMSYKCCNCCAVATHITHGYNNSLRMFCDRCFGMSELRELDEPRFCRCTCKFSPHPDSLMSISGYCCKCNRSFSFPSE